MDNDDWVTTSNLIDIVEKKVGKYNDSQICLVQKTQIKEV